MGVEAVSLRSVEVAPATVVAPPPVPVYDEDELARVTAPDEMSTLESQMAWLAGTTEFGPAVAHRLPPMWMVDGNLAAGRFRWETSVERERLVVPRSEAPVVTDVAICSTPYGNRFFGHHLTDDLVTALVAGDLAEPVYSNPPGALPVNIGAYRKVCDIDLPAIWTARVEGCWVFEDAFLNDSKVERLEQMRTAITAGWGPGSDQERVYIRRGPSGVQRGPGNEAELVESLVADGWSVIEPEFMSTEEVARSLMDARLVAGVEGSQLSHTLLAAPRGSGMIKLMPPNRFNLLYKDFCDRLGIHFGFHVGAATEAGWDVDVEGAQRIIDRVADRLGPRGLL